MKWLIIIVLFGMLLTAASTDNEPACEEVKSKCSSTNYEEYISCVRSKRSTCSYSQRNQMICEVESGECSSSNDDVCDNCDCEDCASESCSNSCRSCCTTACTTHHCCHRTCHNTCRTSSCRKSCRKSCNDKIKPSKLENITGSTDQRANITTVINLHNLLNNTNIINMPISLNNTNTHDITVEGGGGGGGNSTNRCCNVVGPRQCQPQANYPFARCFHYRTRHCGNICTAPIVHSQPHEICDKLPNEPPKCRKQIVYIPQPQPRCAYQPMWPFVSCGWGAATPPPCAGCYSHYGGGTGGAAGCSPYCYDDGFGAGPYFRQGPFYRPGFAHVPSCQQTGTCGFGGLFGDLGYGQYAPFGGLGYDPSTYESLYHVETDPKNAQPNYPMASDETAKMFPYYDPVFHEIVNIPNTIPLNNVDTIPRRLEITANVHPVTNNSDAQIEIQNQNYSTMTTHA